MEKKLPDGWVETSLIDMSNFIDYRGKTPVKTESGIPLITAKNVKKGYINREPREYIAENAYDDWMTRGIPEVGDILITTEAPLGNVALIDIEERFALAQRVITIQVTEKLSSSFLKYYLLSQKGQSELVANSTGTTVSGIKSSRLKQLLIPIAPFNEQQRIVAKLDSLFAHLEEVKTRLEKVPELLKQFRQSVLTQAVTGKLTEEWREGKDLTDMYPFIKELGERRKQVYLNSVKLAKENGLKKPKKDFEFVFERHQEYSGWVKAKLDNLIYMSARIGWKGLKADEYTDEGPLFLSVHSLNYGENVVFDKAYHITNERYEESPEIMLEENDVLLCKDGAGIGKLGIVKNLTEKATVNSSLLVIRGREALNYKYLYYFLAGPALQNIAKERITGTAIPHLFQRDIKGFNLDIPSLEEQTEIVRRVEGLFAKAEAIETKYEQLKTQIDNLPQAILAKAFKGELVEQLPSDGDARELLEEIKKLKAESK